MVHVSIAVQIPTHFVPACRVVTKKALMSEATQPAAVKGAMSIDLTFI